jgi:S1-C subfamily serine protease
VVVGLGVATLVAWQPVPAQQLAELFQKVSPSVVLVRTVERGIAPDATSGLTTIPGLGSGVLISADGKIMTAAHVVQTADRVAVQFQDGKLYPAHVVASSVRADVALLQLDQFPIALAPAKVGNSDSLQVGDEIIVIGAPYGLGHSLTVGHVSGRIPSGGIVSGGPMEMIQTDAAINMGNSGGPMFNMNGEVVGIVSRILTQSGGFEGLGFAIPAKVAQRVLLNARSFWSGIDFVLLQDTLAQVFNLPQSAGLLVQQVAAGSPGALLGVRAGRYAAGPRRWGRRPRRRRYRHHTKRRVARTDPDVPQWATGWGQRPRERAAGRQSHEARGPRQGALTASHRRVDDARARSYVQPPSPSPSTGEEPCSHRCCSQRCFWRKHHHRPILASVCARDARMQPRPLGIFVWSRRRHPRASLCRPNRATSTT